MKVNVLFTLLLLFCLASRASDTLPNFGKPGAIPTYNNDPTTQYMKPGPPAPTRLGDDNSTVYYVCGGLCLLAIGFAVGRRFKN